MFWWLRSKFYLQKEFHRVIAFENPVILSVRAIRSIETDPSEGVVISAHTILKNHDGLMNNIHGATPGIVNRLF